ncbi:MAG TPA: hypothetical protein PLX02_03335 [Syntrophorhabdaceae bacterium]|nr:hypothetical protein [Syntrophorhabdaceae bacterium]HQM80632.1 hypothetical protein [Syntrophorhabdaceae bacterium]
MPVMFFISLGFIIVVLIAYTIYRARQFKTNLRSPPMRFSVQDLKKRDDAFLSAPLQRSAADRAPSLHLALRFARYDI